MRDMSLWRLALVGGLSGVCLAAATPPEAALQTPNNPTGILNQHLPSWIKLSGELRYREEGYLGGGFREGNDDMYLLQRYRIGVELKPLPWLKMFAQGQDSRIFFVDRVSPAPYQDKTDLRQAWVQIGNPEKNGFTVRVGRQELQFGEERLLGAGNWGNVARTFDAVRLGVRHGGYHADLFASSVVAARDGVFDRHVNGDNIHGIYGGIDSWIPKATIEPYVYWRLAPLVLGENGVRQKLNNKTVGVRINGQLPANFEYTTEMVLQRGSWAGEPISAWAGFWRFGRLFDKVPLKPRLRLEVNHASGDSRPHDAHHGTFDVLYPTPHDKYGLADQVGWKNVNHIGGIAEFRPVKALALQVKGHTWWLASATDGLYNAGGAMLFRDQMGLSGKHVGEEVDFQAIWIPAPNIWLGGGVGHMFAGQFLKNVSPGDSYTFPYVMFTYGF